MQWSAELNFTLDIDDFAAAKAHLGRDAARMAEGEIAETDDREPVDLADPFAGCFDADRFAADLLLHALVDAIATPDLGIDRGLDFHFADQIPAGIGGELICL